ncbi:HAD-like protein [Teratosphaeria nubilosa]|uniref:Mitochondrial import inner membrane translocase subunit TIM50 n=1 Tax=Teratosphaeria nubilosa TaxID=161662 RepID=A0A6G1LH34_9PEZI|nr:HAD-like protein [Teratosphaeria nubilosa]
MRLCSGKSTTDLGGDPQDGTETLDQLSDKVGSLVLGSKHSNNTTPGHSLAAVAGKQGTATATATATTTTTDEAEESTVLDSQPMPRKARYIPPHMRKEATTRVPPTRKSQPQTPITSNGPGTHKPRNRQAKTVNNVPSYSTNTNGFAAINHPMPQQWNTSHHMTAHGTNSLLINGQYQEIREVPPPPPQAPHLTKNQRKRLKAKQQAISYLLSPPELTEAELNWFSNSRTASPNPPRLQVMPRPQPDRAYLHQANMPILPLGSPRTLLVILDLNGTLLHRKSKGSTFTARPHVNEFLHYLLTNHAVMVWSSASPENVKAMCGKLFTKPQMQQLIAVWARDKLRLEQKYYNQKVQVYKQLSWVWEELAASGKEAWDQSNTVLIDDSLEKAASEPHNLVQIEEFENRADQQSTDVLGQVVRYLEVARDYSDVSSFMREYPFTYLPEDAPFDWSEILAGMR